jgi:CRISPR/Cas system-associated exonuclease Cas4 (RecB family)
MAQVPASQHTTGEAIVKWRAREKQEHREHLGASLIGHACDRHIWLSFRWAMTPSWDGRMLRLFDRGKREEAVVAEELRGIGVDLHTHDGDKQIECRDESGHFGGSVDGIGRGFPEAPKTWAILEVKTHSAKSFTDLKKVGVAESKPQHYAQMQSYMGLLKLERAMYLAVNKDNDELYTEWVHFDEDAFKAMQERARRIIDSKTPPAKLSEDPAHWQCKGCPFFSVCHEQKVAEVSCRTCCHATPVAAGAWHCDVHGTARNKGEQRSACEQHLFIPDLVPFGEAVDGGVAHIEYRHRETGKTFINGVSGYSSKELSASAAGTVTEPIVEAMRATFTAKVVASKPRRGKRDLSNLPPAEAYDHDFNDPIPF